MTNFDMMMIWDEWPTLRVNPMNLDQLSNLNYVLPEPLTQPADANLATHGRHLWGFLKRNVDGGEGCLRTDVVNPYSCWGRAVVLLYRIRARSVGSHTLLPLTPLMTLSLRGVRQYKLDRTLSCTWVTLLLFLIGSKFPRWCRLLLCNFSFYWEGTYKVVFWEGNDVVLDDILLSAL